MSDEAAALRTQAAALEYKAKAIEAERAAQVAAQPPVMPPQVLAPAAPAPEPSAGLVQVAAPASTQPPPAGNPAPANLPAQVAAAGAKLVEGTPPGTAPGQTPPGILSAEEIAAYEQLPPTRSHREQQERLAQLQQVMDSITYHEGQR